MDVFPRVAGRLGEIVSLNMSFYHNRILESPFAIRRVDIFQGAPRPENLVAQLPFQTPDSTTYPFPATEIGPGQFELQFSIPNNLVPNCNYYDFWYFIGNDPGSRGIDDESIWSSQSGIFWLFDDTWIADDGLFTKRLGFEPLDKKLRRGEIRPLEVAIHPLPLYTYDYNKLAPIIPRLNPTLTMWTTCDELLLSNVPCRIGVRQGHNRNSPFVVQCPIDTSTLLIGTYRYMIKVNIDGNIIASDKFHFAVL